MPNCINQPYDDLASGQKARVLKEDPRGKAGRGRGLWACLCPPIKIDGLVGVLGTENPQEDSVSRGGRGGGGGVLSLCMAAVV